MKAKVIINGTESVPLKVKNGDPLMAFIMWLGKTYPKQTMKGEVTAEGGVLTLQPSGTVLNLVVEEA